MFKFERGVQNASESSAASEDTYTWYRQSKRLFVIPVIKAVRLDAQRNKVWAFEKVVCATFSKIYLFEMKNVIITGSSGMIGGLVLEQCLKRDDVANVTTIVRRTSGIKHKKLTEIIHQNFLDYTTIEQELKNQQVCFFCIGVYTGQVPAPQFKTITVDYTKAFSEALKQQSPDATFCFLSGQGADSSEKSRVLFAREKGIAENALLQLHFSKTHIFRPGYIYPVTPRNEPNAMYKMMRRIYKPLSAIYPNIGVTSEQLAKAMIQVGLNGGAKTIYENADIRRHTAE